MLATTQNETLVTLFKELEIQEGGSEEINRLGSIDSKYLRDLRININNTLSTSTLSKKESYILAYAIALNENNEILKKAFVELAIKEDTSEKEIAEIIACTSLMNTNNVYYRFKHYLNKDFYNNAPAGIRMSVMMNPVLGKEFFELLSLAISAVNGCEMCVTSHEESVLKHGGTQERILDAIRLAAIVKGFSSILK